MDPVDVIIASLNVKGAFLNTPWLHLEAVWKHLGIPLYNFASGCIRTRKYTVRTGAGLTSFLEPGSGVPQGGAEGPLLYLLMTLPVALAIEQDYPGYAPYPLPPPWWASRMTPTSWSGTPRTNPMPQTPGQRSSNRPMTYLT